MEEKNMKINKLKKHGELFKFITKNDKNYTIVNSYYGWEGTGFVAFYNYFAGYWEGAKCLYEKMIDAAKKRQIEITDTMIFPLIYLYRHTLELCLKYLYMKYSHETEIKKQEFMSKNHSLIDLWLELKKYLQLYLNEQLSGKDLDIIENYIKKFNSVDSTSMAFRYPVNKKLFPFHNKSRTLDNVYFCETMNQLLQYLLEIDYELDGKISHLDISNCNISKDELIDIIKKKQIFIKKYVEHFNENDNRLKNEDYQTLVILCLLMYAGRSIYCGFDKISKNDHRFDDFIKLLILTYDELNLDINDETNKNNVIDILNSKTYNLVDKWIKISAQELNRLFKQ